MRALGRACCDLGAPSAKRDRAHKTKDAHKFAKIRLAFHRFMEPGRSGPIQQAIAYAINAFTVLVCTYATLYILKNGPR